MNPNSSTQIPKESPDPTGVSQVVINILRFFSFFNTKGLILFQFKTPLFAILLMAGFSLLILLLLSTFIILTPVFLGEKLVTSVTSLFHSSNTSLIPIDTNFISTAIPRQNPLGGKGFEFTQITAYFLDPSYFLQFGRNHNGIDLIPSNLYYEQNQVYKKYHQVVAYSTINGYASHYIDQYGGETVEVLNKQKNLKVKFIHFSQVFVESGEVIAGTPLGVMGDTGLTTGAHVHYEVLIKDANQWLPQNPLNYIN